MSWWIRSAERTVTDTVPASPAEVRAFYVDLDNLKLLHPFLVSVHSLGRVDGPGGYTQTYRIRENVPLRGLTLPIRFEAELTVPTDGDVVAESRQFPQVRLRTVTAFEPHAAGTFVTERIHFEAPRPLAGFTIQQGCKAHQEMLAGIARHFS